MIYGNLKSKTEYPKVGTLKGLPSCWLRQLCQATGILKSGLFLNTASFFIYDVSQKIGVSGSIHLPSWSSSLQHIFLLGHSAPLGKRVLDLQ